VGKCVCVCMCVCVCVCVCANVYRWMKVCKSIAACSFNLNMILRNVLFISFVSTSQSCVCVFTIAQCVGGFSSSVLILSLRYKHASNFIYHSHNFNQTIPSIFQRLSSLLLIVVHYGRNYPAGGEARGTALPEPYPETAFS